MKIYELVTLCNKPEHTIYSFFFFNDTPTTKIYTLSLHDALPILGCPSPPANSPKRRRARQCECAPCMLDPADLAHTRASRCPDRSEEHTSELQSRGHLVCRLLLEKKKQ